MTFLQRIRVPLLALSFGLLLFVAAAKANAAKPPLGPTGWPGEIDVHLSAAAVTGMLYTAYALGAAAVLAGIRSPRLGSRWWGWALGLGVLVLLISPIGSGDHTNYAAYGRIALQGGDPYTASPEAWGEGLDPITSSVQPPWRDTPSIYGPFGTALMALTSWIGGDDLRRTVTAWQVLIVIAWLGMRWLLLRLAGAGERTRGRVEVLWTFNPLVFGALVLGAHIDVIAGALAVAALVALRHSPLAAGILVGAAASTKLTYAVVALGIIWAWRTCAVHQPDWRAPTGRIARLVAPLSTPLSRSRLTQLGLGALLVIVPCYAVAGPHAFRQLGAAGGSFSYATPAAPLWRALRHVLPEWAVGVVVFTLSAAAMIALTWLLMRVAAVIPIGRRIPDIATRTAVVTTWALSTSYVLLAPYSLPWYDTLTWALLPLLLEMGWDRVLVVRALAMAAAYVPGRVLGLSPAVENFTLTFRSDVAPVVTIASVVAIVAICLRQLRVARRRAAGVIPEVPARARSQRPLRRAAGSRSARRSPARRPRSR
ncbi:hypothetical protein ACMYYO_01280 [Dermacoccaceae bacterium W4C1]